MLTFTLVVIILSVIIIRVINSLNYWKKRGVPYIKTWPIVGGLKDAILQKRNLGPITEECYQKCPGKRYYGTFLFSKPCLTVKDPDLIKKITVKDFDHFVDHVQTIKPEVEPLFGKNLVSLKGETWRKMRNTLSPLFTGSKIRIMFKLISDCAKQLNQHFLIKNPDKNEIIEVETKDIMTRIATDIIATTAFGVNCNSLKEDNEFYKMGLLFTKSNIKSFFKAMIQSLFPKLSIKLGISIVPKDVSVFFTTVIKETLKERKEKAIIRPDMIHLMIETQKDSLRYEKSSEESYEETGFAVAKEENEIKEENHPKNDIKIDDIIAQGFVFFLAGFEIVSSMMAYLCYELAVDPDVQKKLHEEIDEIFKINEDLNYESMVKMKYLDMIISEILRKWPLAIMLNRECTKDYKIPSENDQENDVIIEKGVMIMIPVYGIHRDPNLYPNPEKFDPERFNNENKHKINPYAYLPFGIGPRNCIGSRFAILEAKVLTVYLLWKFEIVPVEKTEIPLKLSPKKPGLSPENFFLGLKRRH